MQTVNKPGQWKYRMHPIGPLFRILKFFLIISLLLPASGVQAQTPVPVNPTSAAMSVESYSVGLPPTEPVAVTATPTPGTAGEGSSDDSALPAMSAQVGMNNMIVEEGTATGLSPDAIPTTSATAGSELTANGESSHVTAQATPETTVTVNTVSPRIDGVTSSVDNLKANPGADGKISFREALTAVNNTGAGYTIKFDPVLRGATIFHDSSRSFLHLKVPNTTIDGDVDDNGTPDVHVGLIGSSNFVLLLITSSNNIIRNLAIEGLRLEGDSAHNNQIIGCHIGTDVAGLEARPEEGDGLQIMFGAHHNIVENNIIAGRFITTFTASGSGVFIAAGAHDNVVRGNKIGINRAGEPLPNEVGVFVLYGAWQNTIGGERSSLECNNPCNIISNNSEAGVALQGTQGIVYPTKTSSNVVQGNFIGVGPTGADPMPNGWSHAFGRGTGVSLEFGATQNTIGGPRTTEACDGFCNVISGNSGPGVDFTKSETIENYVQGNFIGVDVTGEITVPNVNGILVDDGASRNIIGGELLLPGSCGWPCNLIRGNTGAGVRITGQATRGNAVRGNDILYNGGLGIDLGGDGATPNDPLDNDIGPNDLMNFPVDLRAVYDPTSDTTTIRGTLDTVNPASVKVDIYNIKVVDLPSFSEGWQYVGTAFPTSSGQFMLTVSGQLPLPYLTASATDSNGSTSELTCVPNPADPLADSDRDGLKDKDELNTHPDGNTIVTLNLCDPDTDGDGLLDPWEVDPEKVPGGGFDLDSDGKPDDLNSNGKVDTMDRDIVFAPYELQTKGKVDGALRLTGQYSLVKEPNPFYKDIYLEIDWQDCKVRDCPQIPIFGYPGDIDPTHHAPNVGALAQVINLFNQAPVQNPDGRGGIQLHILVDEGVEHTPICDKGESDLRRTHFGTADQRIFNALINGNIIKAKERTFRYVATIHSTVQSGGCPEFGPGDVLPSAFGSAPLPYYDYTPFGNANVGGRDILVSLGPLWVCPQENTLLGFVPVCFRYITGLQVSVTDPPDLVTIGNPGLFPAKIVVNGQTQSFKWPMHMLLGLPSALGSWQVWGRTLMHLLGHSLGLASEDDVKNVPDVPGFNPPETYGNWDNLQYAPKPGGTAPDESFPRYDAAHLEQDLDHDQVKEGQDNCPGMSNPTQADLDGDGYGDFCDPDRDNDLLPNSINFLDLLTGLGKATTSVGLAEATLSVGSGDTTDPFPMDTDNDGMDNPVDGDDDNDGVPDASENCTLTSNSSQVDTDGDGMGDGCDSDSDNDVLPDLLEQITGSDPLNPASQSEFVGSNNVCADGLDNDLDGNVDGNDEGCVDTDSDTAPDYIDNCPNTPNEIFANYDSDDLGNECDPDDDNDTVTDEVDLCPHTPVAALADAKGCSDADVDADGDGILDPFALSSGPSGATGFDNCPIIFNPDQADSDGNGIGDVCEPANLIVITHVVNDNGGTAIAADFAMSATGTNVSLTLFPGDEGGTTVTLNAGDYSVAEIGPTGYVMSLSADCTGTITAGETRTCTVTNDDVPPAGYTLIDLGTLGGSNSHAFHINEAGQVLGSSYLAGDTARHAFVWENGVMTDLGTLGGSNSDPWAINEAGQVIGYSEYLAGDTSIHAFLWENGVMTDLGTLGGSGSVPPAINEAGQIVGRSHLAGDTSEHAFLWENGVMTDLGTLGGSNSQAFLINEAGQVIGSFDLAGVGQHAFLWENGVMTDLGTLGGSHSSPAAINEAGQVIGFSYLAGNAGERAFVWENGVMTDLGTLGGRNSRAVFINEAGQVIGAANVAGDTGQHAFLWENGVMTDLGTLGGSNSNPYAINEAGQVLGFSDLAGNTSAHAFVWENGVMTDLPTLGGNYSIPEAINEAGQVIGRANLAGDTSQHAFVWENGVMTDLGTLGGSSSYPWAINEAGQVIGVSYLEGDTSQHAFATIPAIIVPCSASALIDAINTANNTEEVDTLELSAGCTYTLTSVASNTSLNGLNGLPIVTSEITIIGNGATITRDSGAPAFRIFQVGDGGGLMLENVTISGGAAVSGSATVNGGGAVLVGSSDGGIGALGVINSAFSDNHTDFMGGAILNLDNSVSVIESTFADNSAASGGAIYFWERGGGITDSTFSGNHAAEDGGAIFGVNAEVTVRGSTFSDNSANNSGGGIHNIGDLYITDSTFSDNSADRGGGILANGSDFHLFNNTFSGNSAITNGGAFFSFFPATLYNTIVANSPSGGDCSGEITDGGNNLQSDGTCGETIPTANPLLGPLADNGGPTLTHALLPGSPAIDAGNAAGCLADHYAGTILTTDQRGIPRPLDGDGDGIAICDIGAFEVEVSAPSQPPTVSAGGPYSVVVGASVTVTASGSDPEGGALTYAWDLDNDGIFETPGQSANFSAAGLDSSSSYTITVQVTDNGGLTATDQTTVNVLNVAPTATLTETPINTPTQTPMSTPTSTPMQTPISTPTAAPITIQSLIEATNALFNTGVLDKRGQGKSLIVKLDGALTKLNQGDTAVAINKLRAFINEVDAMIHVGFLAPWEGQPLIDAANAIITSLGG